MGPLPGEKTRRGAGDCSARCHPGRRPLLSGAGGPADARKAVQRQWAIAVLVAVLARLQAELAAEGKQELFEGLKPVLTAGGSIGYARIAAGLGMTEGAVKVAVHRLRRRYRELLRDEIAQTVASPEEIEEEIRHLLSCL